MEHRKSARSFVAITALCVGLAFVCPPGHAAKDPPPEVTKDGLHLYKQTKERLAYVRPGTTFTRSVAKMNARAATTGPACRLASSAGLAWQF